MTDWLLVTVVVVLLGLGLFETVSNTVHLLTGRVDTWGRRQHLELPRTATAADVRRKVRTMLALGVLLVLVTLGSIGLDQPGGLVLAALAAGAVTVLDLVRYRSARTVVALMLALLLLVLTVLAVLPAPGVAPCSCR